MESQPDTDNQEGIVSKVEAGAKSGYDLLYHESLGLRTGVHTSGTTHYENFSQTLSNGTWYHIVFRFTASSDEHSLWVDNSERTATGTQSPGDGTSQFAIGAISNDPKTANAIDGKIDDVRVWSRALSDSEIGDLFNNPCTVSDGSNLEGKWLFDNDGTDESSNSNDLTNNNTATFSTDTAYDCPEPAAPLQQQDVFWF